MNKSKNKNHMTKEVTSMLKTFKFDDVPVLNTTSGKLKGYFYDGEYIFKGSRCRWNPNGKV